MKEAVCRPRLQDDKHHRNTCFHAQPVPHGQATLNRLHASRQAVSVSVLTKAALCPSAH
jgi:hypothetical protein